MVSRDHKMGGGYSAFVLTEEAYLSYPDLLRAMLALLLWLSRTDPLFSEHGSTTSTLTRALGVTPVCKDFLFKRE